MKNLFSLLGFFLTVTLFAQAPIDFHHYQGIKCAGLIPQDFVRPTQEKYNEALAIEIKKTDNKNLAISKDNFLLESNYLIDGLLQSGKVLFGDTVTQYVNQVADHVLINEPALRTKLRFYCLRSTEANAFSTNQGIVFVTLGLLAQLENEAQLAFILSHEIAHYELRHSIDGYVQNDVIFNKKSRYDSYNDRIHVASTYSKEREIQADSLAIVRISKTIYSCDEGIEALFVTQFSALPFEELAFNTAILQPSMMKFPADLFLDSLNPINFDRDEDDDSYSSHPNMATRRKELQKVLEAQTCSGKAKFIEKAEAFLTIRKIARFETIALQLQERSYCIAFYNAFVLLQQDSTNSYLKTCMGKSLYGLAKYKNIGQYSTISTSYFKIEGNQQQCYYFFGKLKAVQLNLIALRYLYELSQTDSSFLIIAMRNDLAEEAVRMNDVHYEKMKTATIAYKESLLKNDTAHTVADTAVSQNSKPVTTPESRVYVSKYDKLREEKKKQETSKLKSDVADQSKFQLLAFSDIIDSPGVIALFNEAENAAAKNTVAIEKRQQKQAEIDRMTYESYSRLEAKEATQIRSQNLGIDTVVFVDPFFMELDDYNDPVFVASENTERALPGLLVNNATDYKITTSVICPKTFTENDVELYNELAWMNEWTSERVDHDMRNILCSSTDKVIPLVQKYHTSHFCYIRIYAYDHITHYYTLMYNITTGIEEINFEDKKMLKARIPLIESLFNITMRKIKSTRNKQVD